MSCTNRIPGAGCQRETTYASILAGPVLSLGGWSPFGKKSHPHLLFGGQLGVHFFKATRESTEAKQKPTEETGQKGPAKKPPVPATGYVDGWGGGFGYVGLPNLLTKRLLHTVYVEGQYNMLNARWQLFARVAYTLNQSLESAGKNYHGWEMGVGVRHCFTDPYSSKSGFVHPCLSGQVYWGGAVRPESRRNNGYVAKGGLIISFEILFGLFRKNSAL